MELNTFIPRTWKTRLDNVKMKQSDLAKEAKVSDAAISSMFKRIRAKDDYVPRYGLFVKVEETIRMWEIMRK